MTATPTRIDDVTVMVWSGMSLCNRGAASVFVGGPGVSVSTGYELKPGEATSIDNGPSGGGVWAVAASGSVRVDRLQSS